MKGAARQALALPLLLAFAPVFAVETRVAPITESIISAPVLSREVRAIDTVPRLGALATEALAPNVIPVLPLSQIERIETVPAAVRAAAAPAAIAQAAALRQQNVSAQLHSAVQQTRGQEAQVSTLENSHWAKVFDGITTRGGKASIPQVKGADDAQPGYLGETRGLGGAALLTKLHEISGRGAKIKHYNEAKSYMFETADHQDQNGKTGIVDAYSGIFAQGTGSDGGVYVEHGDQNHDGYEDKGGMNVEHIWPQSFFNKAEPMRADLHHLMATFIHPNGERSNLPFGEVKGRPEYHNDAGAKLGGGVFEPPDFTKGRVARSLLYFYTRYYDQRIQQGAFSQRFWDENLPMLLRWNRQFPPTDFEKGRNDLVEKFQGNRNPYVDDFTLAERIGENALKTGNRYGVRRGQANYAGARIETAVDHQHIIDGARMRPTPTSLAHPLRLIITGPPGSGKGTFSDKISAEYGVPHISVGELLREHAKTHPAVAKIMQQGKLVDTSLVLAIVRERLRQPDVRSRGFLLDGFPRRQEEAEALQKLLGPEGIDGVISLDVPDEELLRRILARGRADDSEPVFQERMKIYREQTVPAVEVFTKSTPMLTPEVKDSDIATNYAKVKESLKSLVKKLAVRR